MRSRAHRSDSVVILQTRTRQAASEAADSPKLKWLATTEYSPENGYNESRLHSAWGYRPPAELERSLTIVGSASREMKLYL